MDTQPQHEAIAKRVEKIALELVFASAGHDDGLLPTNSLLSDIEGCASESPLPAPIPAAILIARREVDASLDAVGFTPSSLERLNAWTVWMRNAIGAVQRNQPVADLPPTLQAPPPATPPPTASPGAPNPASPGPAPGPVPAGLRDEDLDIDKARDGDLLREFLAESEEHLHNIEQGVLSLESAPGDADTLHSIFRSFHTFKGGSGFLNLKPIHNLAHELESLLDHARQGRLAITAAVIDLILTGADTLRRFTGEIRDQLDGSRPPDPIRIPTAALIARVRAQLASPTAPPPAPAADAPAPDGAPPGPGPAAGPGPAVATPPAPDTAPGDPGRRSGARTGSSFVKVDTQKLDGLVDLVGELVIAQSLVAQDPDLKAVPSTQLPRHLTQLGRLTAELQRTAMSLRMVPIRATFEKMKRLVRDLSLKAGKQVELQFSGEETELDRNLIEKLDDPLVHMIRNAVDHGIEPPDARVAAGKPARGSIHLRAFHRGGNILLEVRDDGGGLKRDRILAKGRRLGMIPEGQDPGDDEVYGLIFAPGFSTADKVTEISGRGVGLDVVHRNITSLRGKIQIATSPGQGSTFTIHLPLTLAIIDGLIVGVGDQRFILPTLSVRESFRPTAGMISTVQGRGEMVDVRGRQCPLLRLHRHLGVTPRSEDPAEGLVIVLESDQKSRCLLVDQLIGKQEVVIKSLGDTFKPCYAVAGAAILGDGRVGLILDVNHLLHPDGAGRSPGGLRSRTDNDGPR